MSQSNRETNKQIPAALSIRHSEPPSRLTGATQLHSLIQCRKITMPGV